jgi:hypothetical protein
MTCNVHREIDSNPHQSQQVLEVALVDGLENRMRHVHVLAHDHTGAHYIVTTSCVTIGAVITPANTLSPPERRH